MGLDPNIVLDSPEEELVALDVILAMAVEYRKLRDDYIAQMTGLHTIQYLNDWMAQSK